MSARLVLAPQRAVVGSKMAARWATWWCRPRAAPLTAWLVVASVAVGGAAVGPAAVSAQTPPLPEASTPVVTNNAVAPDLVGTGLVAQVQVGAAYADHPLVAAVTQRGWLQADERLQCLNAHWPADRAWAAVDAIGAARLQHNAGDRYLLLGIAARLQIGPSGALQPDDVRTEQLDARAALLLGWAKALAQPSARWRQRSDRASHAGALQLLERARTLSPNVQAAQLAYALAAAESSVPACAQAIAVLAAARHSGDQSVRLAVAERADLLIRTWLAPVQKSCDPKQLQTVAAHIQLPPPLPETEQPARTRPPPVHPAQALAGDAWVTAAPFFRGWLDDPVVRSLVMRTPLHEMMLFEVLQADVTGDRTLAVINAALHGRRTGVWPLADLVWRAVVRAQGLAQADADQQSRLKVSELTPMQAVVLGYSVALAPGARPLAAGSGRAGQATAAELFAAARGNLPLGARLGPLVALAHRVDVERVADRCQAARRAEALRVTVVKTDLPAAAIAALRETLVAVEGLCPADAPPQL